MDKVSNFLMVLPGQVLKAFQNGKGLTGLDFKNPPFFPYWYLKEFDGLLPPIEGNALVSVLLDAGAEYWKGSWEGTEGEIVKSGAIAALMTAFLAPTEAEFIHWLPERLSRGGRVVFFQKVRGMLLESLSDPELASLFLRDVLEFYRTVLLMLVHGNRIQMASIRDISLGKVPAFLQETLKTRLFLLSFFPNAREIAVELNRMHSPALFLFRSEPLVSGVNIDVFAEMLPLVLPKGSLHPAGTVSLEDFRKRLYEPEKVGTGKFPYLDPGEIGTSALGRKFTEKDILTQFIIFLMPNWQELWVRSGFLRTIEMQKRLRFLKEVDKFQPSARDLILLFLSPERSAWRN